MMEGAPAKATGLRDTSLCPPLLATALWLRAEGYTGHVRAKRTRNFFRDAMVHRYPEKYLESYLNLEPLAPAKPTPFGIQQERMIDKAVQETAALLRRAALLDLGLDPQASSLAFERHPPYKRALGELELVEERFRDRGEMQLSSCPRCKAVGELTNWFGTRRVKGKEIHQSWCRMCRAVGPYRPPAPI